MTDEQSKESHTDEQAQFDLKNVKVVGTVEPSDYVPKDPEEAEDLRIKMLSLQHLNIVITE